MNLTHVVNQEGDTVTMRLYRPIGGVDGVDGADFADQMDYIERVGFKNINIRINSGGGSVMDGFSIFSAIRNSKCMVSAYVDFMAASIGGVIAMAAPCRYIADNGLFMMHNVEGPDATDKDKEILQKIKNSISSVLSTQGGMTPLIISDMMDKETWLSGQEAKAKGFFTDTFPAVIKADTKKLANDAIKLYHYSNNLFNTIEMDLQKELTDANKKIGEFENRLSTKETELTNKSEALAKKDQEIAELKTKKTELEASIVEKDTKLKEHTVKAATDLVQNAINSGKVKKEQRDSLIKNATENYSLVSSMLESIAEPTVKRFSNVAGSGDAPTTETTISEERKTWTHRDWEKKDPKGLENMYKNEPEAANELYKNTYQN